MVVIIDYDTGNTRSLSKALDAIGLPNIISKREEDISSASAKALILPGVGAFPEAMARLREEGLDNLIRASVAKGTPLLGICLGMQLLFDESEEYGRSQGLGLIPGKIKAIPSAPGIKIPHMGWNQLEMRQTDVITESITDEYVYYVHSYYADCLDDYIVATSQHGINVPGVVRLDNVYGAQFHPEKSGTVGLDFLKAFKKEMGL